MKTSYAGETTPAVTREEDHAELWSKKQTIRSGVAFAAVVQSFASNLQERKFTMNAAKRSHGLNCLAYQLRLRHGKAGLSRDMLCLLSLGKISTCLTETPHL